MAEKTHSRRTLLGTSAATLTVALGGCTGLLGNGTSEEDPSDDDTDSDESESPSTDETDAQTTIYADDFESGTLAGYDIVEYPDDDDTETFHITTDPSRGDYAVQHRTESRYMTPSDPVSLEPPLELSIDFYVNELSGVDIALQHRDDDNLAYIVKAHNSANGRGLQVMKRRNQYTNEQSETSLRDRTRDGMFEVGTWDQLTITWAEDGEITASAESSDDSVSITDTELSGESFRIAGYHASGWAAFDNITVRRSTGLL